ncbi:MAG: energy transducer TonB [Rufibacter sp.]
MMWYKLKILVFLIFSSLWMQGTVFAQENDLPKIKVDTTPDFSFRDKKGSTYEKLAEFFIEHSNLKVLKSKADRGEYSGLVLLNFIVEKNGSLSSIDIKAIGFEPNIEAIEITLIRTGLWEPGILNGEKVRTQVTFPLYVGLE